MVFTVRRLVDLRFAEPPVCLHCDKPFDKPYQRNPEMETHGENIVLTCPHCGCWTVFKMERV